jgi:hypothetical protein
VTVGQRKSLALGFFLLLALCVLLALALNGYGVGPFGGGDEFDPDGQSMFATEPKPPNWVMFGVAAGGVVFLTGGLFFWAGTRGD